MKRVYLLIAILMSAGAGELPGQSSAPLSTSVKEKAAMTPLRSGYVRRPFLGFSGQIGPDGQLSVATVTKGSSAAQAGLQAGDILVSIADRPVKKRIDLIDATADKPVGEPVPVVVLRDGKKLELSVELGFVDTAEPLQALRRLLHEEKKVNLAVLGGELINAELTDPVKAEQWAKVTKSTLLAEWEHRLLKYFSKEKEFSIVDRDAIGQVMKELNFGQSGVVSESVRARMGKTLGATHLLMVEMTLMGGKETGKQRLVEVETGKVLVSCMTGSAAEESPGSSSRAAEASYNFGLAHQKANRNEEAIAAFRQAIKLQPDYAEAWHDLGRVYKQTGRMDEAIEAYCKAVKIKPGFARAWANLGYAYDLTKRNSEAIQAYRQAVKAQPDFAQAWINLGGDCSEAGQPKEAIAAYQQAVKLKADDALVWQDLGVNYARSKQPEEAMSAYRQAVKLQPDLPVAWNNLGECLENAGQTGEAIEAYRQAVKYQPDFAVAWKNLGDVYKKAGQSKESKAAYAEARRLKPDLFK